MHIAYLSKLIVCEYKTEAELKKERKAFIENIIANTAICSKILFCLWFRRDLETGYGNFTKLNIKHENIIMSLYNQKRMYVLNIKNVINHLDPNKTSRNLHGLRRNSKLRVIYVDSNLWKKEAIHANQGQYVLQKINRG